MNLSILSEFQIELIHAMSLRILNEIGVRIPHEETVSRLDDAGADVRLEDEDPRAPQKRTWRVRMPEPVVSTALETAEKRFTIFGRYGSDDPAHTAEFGCGRRNYNSIAGEASWLDAPGGKRRYTRAADIADAARVADALDPITIAGAMADPLDVPVTSRPLTAFITLIRNTVKPVTFWFTNRKSAFWVVEACMALRGGEAAATMYPSCYPLLEPISPLSFPHDGLDLLYETGRIKMPVQIGPMAQMGLTAPMSPAGTMAQQNAEVLAGICAVQAISPSVPVCYGGICHAFDMGTTQMIFGGPEQVIFGAGMTQMAHRYGLPVYVNVGLTDSKRPDAQAGLEIGTTLFAAAAAGADIFGHLGIAGVDQAASLDMLVLQAEAVAYVERTMRELDFSADAFGFDTISEAGPGGSFVGTEHTAMRFRSELWFPSILDRRFYDPWVSDGAQTTEERCKMKKQHILENHRVPPLEPTLDRELEAILEAAGGKDRH